MPNAPILRRSIGDETTRQHEFPDTDRLFLEIDAPRNHTVEVAKELGLAMPREVRQNPPRIGLRKAQRLLGPRDVSWGASKRKDFHASTLYPRRSGRAFFVHFWSVADFWSHVTKLGGCRGGACG
jgi:hypothetical protein